MKVTLLLLLLALVSVQGRNAYFSRAQELFAETLEKVEDDQELHDALDNLGDDLRDIKDEIDEQEDKGETTVKVDLTNITHSIEDVWEFADEKKDEYKDDVYDEFGVIKDFIRNIKEEEIQEVSDLLYGEDDSSSSSEKVNKTAAVEKYHNVTCISYNCQQLVSNCTKDSICSSNFQCQASCGVNRTCLNLCNASFKSKAWDQLMNCMYQINKCSQLPISPILPILPIEIPQSSAQPSSKSDENAFNVDNTIIVEDFVCLEPPVQTKVELWKLENTWFVTHGFNSDFDCFACQKYTFTVDFGQTEPFELNSVYSMNAFNGSLIWNDNQMTGWKENQIFYFTGRDNGIDVEREWSILFQSEDTLVVYYCMNALGMESQGVLVMSTTDKLKQEKVPKVQRALASIDLTLEDLCAMRPEVDCINAPAPFIPYEKRDPPEY